jgi:hypothetical protein
VDINKKGINKKLYSHKGGGVKKTNANKPDKGE